MRLRQEDACAGSMLRYKDVAILNALLDEEPANGRDLIRVIINNQNSHFFSANWTETSTSRNACRQTPCCPL